MSTGKGLETGLKMRSNRVFLNGRAAMPWLRRLTLGGAWNRLQRRTNWRIGNVAIGLNGRVASNSTGSSGVTAQLIAPHVFTSPLSNATKIFVVSLGAIKKKAFLSYFYLTISLPPVMRQARHPPQSPPSYATDWGTQFWSCSTKMR